MSTLKEVEETYRNVIKFNKKIALTQCTSIYPCLANIRYRGNKKYIKKFKLPIGLSDHTNNIYTSSEQ